MLISDTYRAIRGDELFHFTHINNITDIEKHGKIFCLDKIKELGLNPEHITNSLSRNLDKILGNNKYVFLTFSISHPFIYKQIRSNVDLVEMVLDISIIDEPGVLISDRVANDNSANFYTPEQALSILKIDYCYTGRINNRAIWEEVKKYEILIPESIDLKKYFLRARRINGN